MKTKVFRSICAATLLMTRSAFAQDTGGESRFDTLAKSIAPIIALLTPAGSNGNHAVDLQATIAASTGLPPELKGAPVHVAFEFPDKLLVQFPTPRGPAIICRDKQTVWAFPAAQFQPLVEKVGVTISTEPLPPFQLEETKAVLLPALFDVHNAGSVKLDDQTYRVLDVGIVGRKKKHAGRPVRLWIRPENHTVAQIQLRAKDWDATLEINKIDLSPSLPETTWQPTPAQHDQVTAIPGDKIAALLQLALKQNR